MAIRLCVEYQDETRITMRVCDHQTFDDYWLPGAFALNLTLVPLFETGYPLMKLNNRTIPPLLDELQKLHRWMVGSDSIPNEIAGSVNKMIAVLQTTLESWSEIEMVTL